MPHPTRGGSGSEALASLKVHTGFDAAAIILLSIGDGSSFETPGT